VPNVGRGYLEAASLVRSFPEDIPLQGPRTDPVLGWRTEGSEDPCYRDKVCPSAIRRLASLQRSLGRRQPSFFKTKKVASAIVPSVQRAGWAAAMSRLSAIRQGLQICLVFQLALFRLEISNSLLIYEHHPIGMLMGVYCCEKKSAGAFTFLGEFVATNCSYDQDSLIHISRR